MSVRGAAGWIALALLATTWVGCKSEAETVVETWEELGEIIADNQDDCDALAEAIGEFQSEHGDLFASDMTPIYEEIDSDPELRFRMERAMADLQTDDFACREHTEVRKVSRELFGSLIDASGSAE